ncbi:zinc-dependent metalloprotease family protein [Pyxidicoccus caerfyrddinensis]|uniref:zinc-dependent metalloprotease family protein n=1 Tax=Pyxidicoccus caerfyrddinensis TaxID=2709663 RepID=UPI0013DA9EC1|nr:zinc-dependent metalloprotease family protein [Pyxidicoccus caerfyrddinensis]
MLAVQNIRLAIAVAFLLASIGICEAAAKQYLPLVKTPLPARDANAPALNTRAVRLDASIVPDKPGGSTIAVKKPVYLELFHDAKFKTSLRQSCSDGGCSLSGTIDNQPGSTVVLLRKGPKSLVGNVRDSNGRTFQISPAMAADGKVVENGSHVIQRLKPQVFPDERSPALPTQQSTPGQHGEDINGMTRAHDTNSTIEPRSGAAAPPAPADTPSSVDNQSRRNSSENTTNPAGATSSENDIGDDDDSGQSASVEETQSDGPESTVQHAPDEIARLNVLVLYTANAKKAVETQGKLVGRTKSIEDEIRLAVEVANQSFENSAIRIALNIVAVQETAYMETNGGDPFSAALGELSESAGIFSGISDLKAQHNAHLVSLWIAESPNVTEPSNCGLAYLLNAPPKSFGRYAFSVVHGLCGLANFSFAHEVGHNLGAQHNREVEGDPTDLAYNFGYVVPSRKFRCVMSYKCETVSEAAPCVRQPIWSNPNKLWLGETIGIAAGSNGAADNARELNQNRFVAADFWQRVSRSVSSKASADKAPSATADKPSRRPKVVP